MDLFAELARRTKELDQTPSFDNCKKVVLSVIKFLEPTIDDTDLNLFELFTDDGRKLAANASWFLNDSVVKDHKATYQVLQGNSLNIDFKLYGVQTSSKRVISWAQALTPNFEDEPFYEDLNLGIDFIVPKSFDRVYVALSSNYVVRTLELTGDLTVTFEAILSKWSQISDFNNKRQVHAVLWESFDLQPINRKFYEGISSRFTLLVQHLTTSGFSETKAVHFTNRLIGRLVFCWFIRKKQVISHDEIYFNPSQYEDDTDYYRDQLESLFFKVLNTQIEDRKVNDNKTPFLNGGLFEASEDDFFGDSSLTFPSNYFDDFYAFLNSYNFTTDESTSNFQQVAIDPEMLGRIFENLLAEIVEETGEQARKAKGAFYTPREIVDAMCKRALMDYLRSSIEYDVNRDQRLEQLIFGLDRDFVDQDHNWRRDWKPYKDEILLALRNLKVLDPACGSGAFPIGMLQLLHKTYERLQTKFDSYETKLSVIRDNLYGVDIEPMAVEISRLRAWLSLIVDVEGNSDKIPPLPNLDFKFVAANSLVPLNSEDGLAFGEDPELSLKLQEIQRSFFNTSNPSKKSKLKSAYNKLVSEETSLFGESTRNAQLKSYRPFEVGGKASFFDPNHMFGFSHFDIVIANPPYVSALLAKRTTDSKTREIYKQSYQSAVGAYDLYILFFELGIRLLSENGILVYITPRKYLSALYGEAFRSLIGMQKIDSLIDFSDARVFESAGVSTLISVFSEKRLNEDVSVKIFSDAEMRTVASNLTFPRSCLTSLPQNSWGFLITTSYDLLMQAHSSGITFESILGVNSSSTAAEGDEFKAHISDVESDFKMLNTGNLGPWVSRWGKVAYSNGKEKLSTPYLNTNVVNARRKKMYAEEKIIIGKLAKKIIATLDPKGEFASSNTTFVYDFSSGYSLWLVGAILNSQLINEIYRIQFAGLNLPGDSYQYQAPQIRLLPLPRINEKNIKLVENIESLSKQIFHGLEKGEIDSLGTSSLQDSLEDSVRKLYGVA